MLKRKKFYWYNLWAYHGLDNDYEEEYIALETPLKTQNDLDLYWKVHFQHLKCPMGSIKRVHKVPKEVLEEKIKSLAYLVDYYKQLLDEALDMKEGKGNYGRKKKATKRRL